VTLKELIDRLLALPGDTLFERGFGAPHSWRGVYAELSFTPEDNVTARYMLAHATSAVMATYTGWKGGDFTMTLETPVHLDHEGSCSDDGDGIMELFGQIAPKETVLAGSIDLDEILKKEMQDPAFRRKFLRYYREAVPKPRKQVAGCVYILRDAVCRKKSAGLWRVLAMAPQNSGQKAFMLVSLCKRHGEKSVKKR
jgi:hypothetical protein